MIRYVFAMHVPAFGRSLKLPLNLDDLGKPGSRRRDVGTLLN